MITRKNLRSSLAFWTAGLLSLSIFGILVILLVFAPPPEPTPPAELSRGLPTEVDPDILIPADVRPEPPLRWQTLPRAYSGEPILDIPEEGGEK